jgi:biopolymer transport protein ExbB
MKSSLTQRLQTAFMMLGTVLLTAPVLLAQGAPDAAGAAAQGPKKIQENLWDEVVKGGWVMIPIGICSVALIWLVVDCWMRTSIKRLAPDADVAGARDLFRMGDYVGAYQHCKNGASAFCDVVRVALSFVGDGQAATEEALGGELAKANAQIQTRINYLSVLGVCTPMIGLVGTVTGMIKAFKTLGADGIGSPDKLSAAIGEVLVATASGLFIAIPAFMFFYFLRNKLQGSMHKLQDVTTGLFRKMPYEHLKDCHVGEEEFFAATPNWVGADEAGQPVAA